MITVQLDENKYFTGSYAKIGSIPGGVKVPTLPEDLTNHKTTCWKWGTYQVDVEVDVIIPGKPILVPVIDEVTQKQKVDEEGQLVFVEQPGEPTYEKQTIKQDVVGWIFDEVKHAALLKEISEAIPVQTNEEKIAELEEKNANLEATMDLLLTDIIPGLIGQ